MHKVISKKASPKKAVSSKKVDSPCSSLSPWSQGLREIVVKEANYFTEQPLWIAESFKATEREPFKEVRVGKAVAHLFASMPIDIRFGERLVGWHPNSTPDAETENRIKEARSILHQENWRGFVCEGHLAPDAVTVCHTGLRGVKARLEQGLSSLDAWNPETPRKKAFYEGSLLALEGMQGFIRRYARLAEEMAVRTSDPDWKADLMESSHVCDWISEDPPRTFREAIQLTWFMFLCIAVESGESHNCFGPGRLDQILHRTYLADRQASRLDEDLVDDLLSQFFIKCNEFQARGMSAVIMVVGGRKADGSDATNELSYKMLEACDRARMYFPGVDVSWHKDMDPTFTRLAVKLLRNLNGQPAFFNSDLIVKGLVRHGVPFEHAVDHLPSTCTETSIMGRSNPNVAYPYVNLAMAMLYGLFGGKHPLTGKSDQFGQDVGLWGNLPQSWREATGRLLEGPPQTFAEAKADCLTMIRHAAAGAVAQCQSDLYLESIHRPFPLLSCFIQGCVEKAQNIAQGGALYNFIQPEAVGASNVVDGLAAIRTLVEEEKRFSLDEFRSAICADFAGYEALWHATRDQCPKHGNDVDWVNDLFADVAGTWCRAFDGQKNLLGGPFFPGFLGWVVWIGFGENTPATPDGRKAKAPLANSIVNCTGTVVKGFPSVVLSTAKFDQSQGLGGVVFNVRFQADALNEDKGVDALKGLIEAAFDLGCYQMQVNLASTEVLRAAQEKPDDHADLLVRIGGYLVPFTCLPRHAQDEVIARAELEV